MVVEGLRPLLGDGRLAQTIVSKGATSQDRVQRPNLILSVSNIWWAKGAGISRVEQNTSAAWGRLLKRPMILAITPPVSG